MRRKNAEEQIIGLASGFQGQEGGSGIQTKWCSGLLENVFPFRHAMIFLVLYHIYVLVQADRVVTL